jgi:hypothetical protein
MTGEVTRKKVQLELGESSLERLRWLKSKMDGSYADVVRNALRLFEAVVKEHDEGKKFLVQDTNGSTRELMMFFE